jgi:glycosyltransferase involved in cell wall biosynthesis
MNRSVMSELSSVTEEQSARLPKTLLLCRNIPPAPTGASVVIANLARQFRTDEMVIVGAYYLRTPAQTWSPEWPALKYAVVQLPDGWRGARWLRWIQFPLLLLRAWWTLMAGGCKAIVVVFPDEVFLLTAYLLARMTGKPLYPYLHNTYLENRPNNRLARWLQPRVFAIASHVFVMSEGMRRLFRVNYPDLRCSALVHSFNQSIPERNDTKPPPVHQPLRLVMFGNVGPSNADAAARFAQLARSSPYDLRLTVFSGTSRSYLKQLGFTGDNIVVETVSHDVLMQGLKQSDIILLPHGFFGAVADDEITTIFPTRTIEALISGRPILAHTPSDCFLAEFLRQHQCAVIVDKPEVAAIEQAVERLRLDPDLRSQVVRQALLAAEQFQAPRVAAHLRDIVKHRVLPSQQAPEPSAENRRAMTTSLIQ